MTTSTEQAIIQAVKDGQPEQYRFLVERYHRGLIQHLYNFVHDEQLAEDIAQDAFIRAYTKLHQYNEAYAFSTWLYTIADNLALKQLKKHRPTTDIDAIAEQLPDEGTLSIEEHTDKLLSSETIRRAVNQLPLLYQRVIVLYYWDNFSYEEIAQVLDRPIGTVRTWLYRAKEQLRKELS